MITKQEVEIALQLIADYEHQLQQAAVRSCTAANQIGSRVKYSKYGKENEPKPNHNRKGTVVQWLKWCSETDGLVWVKWDGVAKPETMHISHIELLK